ncbi:MAG: hypothetical protein ACYDDI_01055 [Candidatus Acidiferrales bacterium]
MRASDVTKNLNDETMALINSTPQAAPEPSVGAYLGREIARHVAAGKPRVQDPNVDVAPDIIDKIRKHLRSGEKFMQFISRTGLGPVQIRQFTPEEIAAFVANAEATEADSIPLPITRMPTSSPKPQPARKFIALGDFGER